MGRTNVERLDGPFALANGKLGGVCNGTRRVEGGEGRAKRWVPLRVDYVRFTRRSANRRRLRIPAEDEVGVKGHCGSRRWTWQFENGHFERSPLQNALTRDSLGFSENVEVADVRAVTSAKPIARRRLRQCLFSCGRVLGRYRQDIRWAAFGVLMGPLHSSSDGAPSLPAADHVQDRASPAMVRALGPGAEEAVRDRLSFRRFCGIPLDQETPDHSSIWRFRQRIEKLGLSEKLLAEVNRQLDARGLIVKRGTLVDATIIAAAVKPPSSRKAWSASAIPTRASR